MCAHATRAIKPRLIHSHPMESLLIGYIVSYTTHPPTPTCHCYPQAGSDVCTLSPHMQFIPGKAVHTKLATPCTHPLAPTHTLAPTRSLASHAGPDVHTLAPCTQFIHLHIRTSPTTVQCRCIPTHQPYSNYIPTPTYTTYSNLLPQLKPHPLTLLTHSSPPHMHQTLPHSLAMTNSD